jgi:hypothetical protein
MRKFVCTISYILLPTSDNDKCSSVDYDCQVYTKPFSMLPLSAVEKPGNLYVDVCYILQILESSQRTN